MAPSVTPAEERVSESRDLAFEAASPASPPQCALGEVLPMGGMMEGKTSPCPK